MKSLTKVACAAALLASAVAAQAQTLQSWMSPEVAGAWASGYKGQGVTVKVIDDFRSANRSYGNLGTGTKLYRHGEWTYTQAQMLAPAARFEAVDFTSGSAIRLNKGLNVFNMSYGLYARDGFAVSQIGWDKQDKSIISAAFNGTAILAKAAGNDAVAVGKAASDGYTDYMNKALIGSPTTIFVGALDKNGTVASPAQMAYYSNVAGNDLAVQKNFLVVGVEGSKTGLYGTSFAAPVISGYAAILGSKFTRATPTQITNQLLNTARTDTVANYSASVHGRGEASLTRALAPVSIR